MARKANPNWNNPMGTLAQNGKTLNGSPKSTHKITIPGTQFQAWVIGEDAAVKLAAKLAKTSTGKVGRRTIKAQPIITELETAK